MASRVNVKFVITLTAVLALVFGGVVGAYLVVKHRSGERYLRMGDEAMARQDFTAADAFYARAVGREPTNVEWLKKWRESRERKVPETFPIFRQDYQMYVGGILRALATAQRTNVDAYTEYLEALYRQSFGGDDRRSWDDLITAAEFCMGYFGDQPPAAIRRYRGLAVAAMVGAGFEVTSEQLALGREDLEAALAADPGDVAAARELARWHHAAAQRATRRNDEEARRTHLEEARRVVEAAAAANPGSLKGPLGELEVQIAEVELLPVDRPAAAMASHRAQLLQQLQPALEAVHARFVQAEPAELSPELLGRYYQASSRISPRQSGSMSLELVEQALQHHPDSGQLLMTQALLLRNAHEWKRAKQVYRRVAALPNPPVGLEGLLVWHHRDEARFHIASLAISLAMQEGDPEERQAALERARDERRALARVFPERSPEMLFLDGKLAFAENDASGAQRALSEYIRTQRGEQDAEALVMLIQAALHRNTPGLAREHLATLRRLRPDSLEVMLTLGSIERQLENTAAAEAIFREVLLRDPENRIAREELRLIAALRGEGEAFEDEVVQVLVQAERLFRGTESRLGDEQAARALLRRALPQHGHDPRLAVTLAQLETMRGETQAALAILDEARVHHPENQRLAQMRQSIEAGTSLEAMLAMIDEADLTELQRLNSRFQAYLAHNETEKADAALQELARLAPDDPGVIAMRFHRALASNDLAEAERLADRAARLDLDRAEGDIYRAHLQIARGDARQAVGTLERAVARGNITPDLVRLLGSAQMEIGRTTEAIATFRRALDLSPTDTATVRMLIQSLVQNNQRQEALAVAREAESFARQDPAFLHLWLSLEADAGRTRFAREWREQILARSPDNTANKVALARLYITERQFDRARRLIDSLDQADSLEIAALDAHWHAERGDLSAARQVFLKQVEARQNEGRPTMDVWLVLSEFMFDRNQIEAGFEALRQAASEQDPETRNVDVLTGNVLLMVGRAGEAEAMYQSVLDAGVPDPQHSIRKQLVRAQVNQRRFAEAQSNVSQIQGTDDDIDFLALRAEIARGLGDTRRARELLDRIVARFPEEPLGYLHRARLLMSDPAFARDALADLGTVLRLQPGHAHAHVMRAQIHLANDRIHDGLDELARAAAANPGLHAVRQDAIRWHLLHERESRAVELASAGAAQPTANANTLIGMADVFAEAGRWEPAVRFYRQAWEQSPNERTALRLLQALLNAVPAGRTNAPQLTEAQQVLASPSLNVDRSINLLMMRAALRLRQGRDDAARGDALQAFSLVGNEPRLLLAWQERLVQIHADRNAALAVLDAARPAASIQGWYQFARILTIASMEERQNEVISMLRSLGESDADLAVRTAAFQKLSSLLLREERPGEALEATLRGLEINADDLMLNNNAAHILLIKKERGHEALPYARKAAELAPDNRVVLDTLSAVLWEVDEKREAISILRRAVMLSQIPADQAQLAIKLAGWKLETGDRAGAIGMAELVRDIIRDNPQAGRPLSSELDDLLAAIQKAQ